MQGFHPGWGRSSKTPWPNRLDGCYKSQKTALLEPDKTNAAFSDLYLSPNTADNLEKLFPLKPSLLEDATLKQNFLIEATNRFHGLDHWSYDCLLSALGENSRPDALQP